MVGSLATLPHSNSIGMPADLSAPPQRVFRRRPRPPTLTRGSIGELRIQAIVFAGSLFSPDIGAQFLSIPRFRAPCRKEVPGGGGVRQMDRAATPSKIVQRVFAGTRRGNLGLESCIPQEVLWQKLIGDEQNTKVADSSW
jgi:hypothetical protein